MRGRGCPRPVQGEFHGFLPREEIQGWRLERHRQRQGVEQGTEMRGGQGPDTPPQRQLLAKLLGGTPWIGGPKLRVGRRGEEGPQVLWKALGQHIHLNPGCEHRGRDGEPLGPFPMGTLTSVHFIPAYSRTWTQAWSRTKAPLPGCPEQCPFLHCWPVGTGPGDTLSGFQMQHSALCLTRRPAPERAMAAIRHPLFWGFPARLDRDPRREQSHVSNIQWQCLNGAVLTSEEDPLLWAEGLGSRRDNGGFSWRPGFWQGQQLACRTAWKRWASWCWRTEETEEPTVFSRHRDFGRSGWTPPQIPDLQAYLPPFSLRHQSASAIHPSIHQPSVSLRMMVAVVKMKQERAQSSTKPTHPIWRNGER